MNFLEFNQKFPTEKAVVNHYLKIKYRYTITCPHCNSQVNISRYKKRIKFIQCNHCNNTFSLFTGTIFEKSTTDLRKWFYAIHLVLNAKKGVSGYQLMREIGVTYKCAWRMLGKIRLAMGNVKDRKLFRTVVEIDETYIGGKPRREYDENNKVIHRFNGYNKRGRGTKKEAVVGIKERKSGFVHAQVMPPNKQGKKLTGNQLLSVLRSVCKENATIMTDDFRSYDILDRKNGNNFKRYVVNHSMRQYSAGNGIHTNGIESFWAILKRSWYGTYHHISVKYLQNYVNECCFRNNHKADINAFNFLLKQTDFGRKKSVKNRQKGVA